jgi:hypothetical protein
MYDGVASSVVFGPMPFLAFLFAVTMGVNHGKTQNNEAANRQDDDERLILPNLADKCGCV